LLWSIIRNVSVRTYSFLRFVKSFIVLFIESKSSMYSVFNKVVNRSLPNRLTIALCISYL
jgi:hypothetical protein